MGCLICTIIATLLCHFDIISVNTFVTLVFGILAWTYIDMGLYFKLGWFKFWYHDLLAWHTPDDGPESFDGCSIHARCKHCGKEIMQDSQGNWFTFR